MSTQPPGSPMNHSAFPPDGPASLEARNVVDVLLDKALGILNSAVEGGDTKENVWMQALDGLCSDHLHLHVDALLVASRMLNETKGRSPCSLASAFDDSDDEPNSNAARATSPVSAPAPVQQDSFGSQGSLKKRLRLTPLHSRSAEDLFTAAPEISMEVPFSWGECLQRTKEGLKTAVLETQTSYATDLRSLTRAIRPISDVKVVMPTVHMLNRLEELGYITPSANGSRKLQQQAITRAWRSLSPEASARASVEQGGGHGSGHSETRPCFFLTRCGTIVYLQGGVDSVKALTDTMQASDGDSSPITHSFQAEVYMDDSGAPKKGEQGKIVKVSVNNRGINIAGGRGRFFGWKSAIFLPHEYVYAVTWGDKDQRTGVSMVMALHFHYKGANRLMYLQCTRPSTTRQWLCALQIMAYSERPPPRVLALVCPASGKGTANSVMEKIVRPTLESAGSEVTVVETTHAGHAQEIAAETDFSDYDVVALLSGDGIVNEFVNGLFSRPDAASTVPTISLAHVPSGSGNALASSFGLTNPAVAAWALLKDNTTQMDICSLWQGQKQSFFALNFLFGIVADVDFMSEPYRYLGEARFTLVGLREVLMHRGREYHGRLRMLMQDDLQPVRHAKGSLVSRSTSITPRTVSTPSRSQGYRTPPPRSMSCSSFTRCSSWGSFGTRSPLGEDPLQEGVWALSSVMNGEPQYRDVPPPTGAQWREIDDSWSVFMASNVPHLTSSVKGLPFAKLDDGMIDVCFQRGEKGPTSLDLLTILCIWGNGDHVNLRKTEYYKCMALEFIPEWEEGNMGVDGERIHFDTAYIEVVPSAMKVVRSPAAVCRSSPRGIDGYGAETLGNGAMWVGKNLTKVIFFPLYISWVVFWRLCGVWRSLFGLQS